MPPDVPTFVAPPGDALTRILAAAEAEQADALVRVRADNPYVDPLLVDRLVITAEAHPSCDYISYSRADGRPAILSQLGVCAEWCSVAALRRAATVARRSADRQDVTAYLYGHPELFSVRLIPLPRELDRDDSPEQEPAGPAVLGLEIGECKPPDGGQTWPWTRHGHSPVRPARRGE